MDIFVKDFPENWTENDFLKIFMKYGSISSIKVSQGKAYLLFSTQEEAQNAINGELFNEYEGKKIFVTNWQNIHKLDRKIKRRNRAIRRPRFYRNPSNDDSDW